ncbi:MAG: ATP-binding cassette domain-containing protein [Verrucomicrobiota bacterium]
MLHGGQRGHPRGGEFVGIFGRTARGKTTLVRAIVNTLRPAGGRDPHLRRAARARLAPDRLHAAEQRGPGAHRAERPRLDHRRGAGESWGVPWPSRAARAEVDRVLQLTGAAPYADRPFTQLSGGERQRVMLAQALLGAPKILVLDEPLAGLDPRNQALLNRMRRAGAAAHQRDRPLRRPRHEPAAARDRTACFTSPAAVRSSARRHGG